jgi:hemin uptake protein HemP
MKLGNANEAGLKEPAPAAGPAPGTLPHTGAHVTSASLLGRGRELVILHRGREYRLRLTQNNKLILTA